MSGQLDQVQRLFLEQLRLGKVLTDSTAAQGSGYLVWSSVPGASGTAGNHARAVQRMLELTHQPYEVRKTQVRLRVGGKLSAVACYELARVVGDNGPQLPLITE